MKTYSMAWGGKLYNIAAEPVSRVGSRLELGLPYEHKLLAHIAAQGYRGTAIDVGAHIGNHALYLAAVCGLYVVAFEPIHGRALEENVERNPGLAVEPILVALGDRNGWVCPVGFGSQRAPVGWGPVELRPCEEGTPDAVPVRTLDSYGFENVSVIKIDVEGMEPEVLRGSAETLSRCKPDVYAESRDPEAYEAISQVLTPLGYKYVLTAKTSTPVDMWSPAE